MLTVAEGVETVSQLDFLERLGGDFAQGYLFAKPLPPADFERLLLCARPFQVARPSAEIATD
ncbi:EAL domain-containing protein [Acidisoma silvae]|uniref:EAL domain-containing protein n=1 Tax=Acidisoma silvae TaxID=2802396 RepID=UPI003873C722